ncbi:hypothetical protein [Lacipirellula sp.]|uniref:hypothetical protein n=1 Tax=Lacipirellula sp. TaxID=2691419 RepID=UPI003D0D5244
MIRSLINAANAVCQWGGQCAFRSVVLAVALVAYGSIPSLSLVQTEVESEVQEEAATASKPVGELRRSLRYVDLAYPVKSGQVAAHVCRSPALAAHYIDSIPHLSAGLALPLRC